MLKYIMRRFCDYLAEVEDYPHEQAVLSQLSRLDMIGQALLDIKLHNQAIGFDQNILDADSEWKYKFIDIIKGVDRNPQIIRQTIDIIKRDIKSHLGRVPNMKTGSGVWHKTWVNIYRQWLQKLQELINES